MAEVINVGVLAKIQRMSIREGLSLREIARPLAEDSSQLVPQTLQNIVNGIETAGATTKQIEQYP